MTDLKVQRKDLRRIGVWAADSCSGVPYDPEQYIILRPVVDYEIVEAVN